MGSKEFFGESELIHQKSQHSSVQSAAQETQSAKLCLDGWTGRLLAVDEDLTMRLWKKLLAEEESLKALRSDHFLQNLQEVMKSPCAVSADTNASYIAKSLAEASDSSSVLPLGSSSSLIQNGNPIRITGTITYFRKVANGWTISIGQSPDSALIRFHKNVFIHDYPHGLTGQNVLVLGIVEKLHRLELTGIALIVRNNS